MSFARGSLRSFLATAKRSLRTAIINKQNITLVIGNDSADLDSITSAIVLAYFRSASSTSTSKFPPISGSASTSEECPVYIPVLNIPQDDIRIRPELLTLLPFANLEPSHLITLDDLTITDPSLSDITSQISIQPENTHLILVDHNSLAGPLASLGFSDRVIGCIDHHIDEGTTRIEVEDEPWIIEKVGSCTSLVTRYCKPTWEALSSSASSASRAISGQSDAFVGNDDAAVRRTWDAQIATFAIASVLDDTHNLTSKSKTTEVDAQAVKYLESKILLGQNPSTKSWDRKAFYKKIHHAKQAIEGLTPSEILRKDYKHWDVDGKQLGIASVVKHLTWQIDKAGGTTKFRHILKEFAVERNLNVFAIMTHDKNEQGVHQREILLWAVGTPDDAAVAQFEKDTTEKLGLKSWNEREGLDATRPNEGVMKIWWQEQTQYSRKLVAPLMRTAMKEALGSS